MGNWQQTSVVAVLRVYFQKVSQVLIAIEKGREGNV